MEFYLYQKNGATCLEWSEVKNAYRYDVYYRSGTDGQFRTVFTCKLQKFIHYTAIPGVESYYYVKVVDEKNKTLAVSDTLCIVPEFLSPRAAVEHNSKGKPHVYWTPVKGAEVYEVAARIEDNDNVEFTVTTEREDYYCTRAVPGVKYRYTVTAIDKDNNRSDESNVVEITCLHEKLSLSLELNAERNAIISWENPEGLVTVVLERSDETDPDNFTALANVSGDNSFVDSDLRPGGIYFYRAKGIFNDHIENNISSILRYVHPHYIDDKIEVTISLSKNGKPYLRWNDVEGAAKYRIYSSDRLNGKYSKAFETVKHHYENKNHDEGETKFYKVVAVHDDELEGCPSNTVSLVNETRFVKGLAISADANGKPRLRWSNLEGAVSYEVYCKDEGSEEFLPIFKTDKHSYTNTRYKEGQIRQYKVCAVFEDGQRSQFSKSVLFTKK